MKKAIKNIVLAFTCFLALVFVGNTTVKAETFGYLDNLNISSKDGIYKLDLGAGSVNMIYYAINDTKDTTLTLGYKKNVAKAGSTLQFDSNITLVRCEKENEEAASPAMCTKSTKYQIKVNRQDLIDGDFQLPLNVLDGLSTEMLKNNPETDNNTTVNGTDLTTLNSLYGLDKTIFLVIDYTTTEEYFHIWSWSYKTKVVDAFTQVVRLVSVEEIGGPVTITHSSVDNKYLAKVEASVNLKTVKYFTSSQNYDFGKLHSDSGKSFGELFAEVAKNETVEEITINPSEGEIPAATSTRIGRVFSATVEFTKEDEKFYYVYAEDVFENQFILDITDGPASDPDSKLPPVDPLPPVAQETNVGKIILISLVGLLVVIAVLVIVQRIVDHRRRLY